MWETEEKMGSGVSRPDSQQSINSARSRPSESITVNSEYEKKIEMMDGPTPKLPEENEEQTTENSLPLFASYLSFQECSVESVKEHIPFIGRILEMLSYRGMSFNSDKCKTEPGYTEKIPQLVDQGAGGIIFITKDYLTKISQDDQRETSFGRDEFQHLMKKMLVVNNSSGRSHSFPLICALLDPGLNDRRLWPESIAQQLSSVPLVDMSLGMGDAKGDSPQAFEDRVVQLSEALAWRAYSEFNQNEASLREFVRSAEMLPSVDGIMTCLRRVAEMPPFRVPDSLLSDVLRLTVQHIKSSASNQNAFVSQGACREILRVLSGVGKGSLKLCEASLVTIATLCRRGDGKGFANELATFEFLECGLLKGLARLMTSRRHIILPGIARAICEVLRDLAISFETRSQLGEAGACEWVVFLMTLHDHSPDCVEWGFRALRSLSNGHVMNKLRFNKLEIAPLCVRLFYRHLHNTSVCEKGCSAVWSLSCNCYDNKKSFALANLGEALLRILQLHSLTVSRIAEVGCAALWSVLSSPDEIRDLILHGHKSELPAGGGSVHITGNQSGDKEDSTKAPLSPRGGIRPHSRGLTPQGSSGSLHISNSANEGSAQRALRPGSSRRAFEHPASHHPIHNQSEQLMEALEDMRKIYGDCEPSLWAQAMPVLLQVNGAFVKIQEAQAAAEKEGKKWFTST